MLLGSVAWGLCRLLIGSGVCVADRINVDMMSARYVTVRHNASDEDGGSGFGELPVSGGRSAAPRKESAAEAIRVDGLSCWLSLVSR